jgi:hypothetical protein
MRTPNDICLLCDTNHATKENSHIIPKFIGKSIFGDTNVKRAYILDTNKGHLPADFTQDSVKENYLFCPKCESYFSIIETYIAERLHKRLWTSRLADQFPLHDNGAGVNWKVCAQVDPEIFRLFIYSIIWRCSHSENKLHVGFKLNPEEESLLKNELKYFISDTYKQFIAKVQEQSKKVATYPFVIYTAKSFPNSTNNIIYTSTHNRNPFVLHLNEYVLIFSFDNVDILKRFDFLVNANEDPIKIGFFSEEFWISENKRFMNTTAEMSVKRTLEAGNTPYVAGNL